MGLKMPGSMKTMSWAPPSGTGWEVGKIQLPFTCWMKLNPRVFRTVLGLCHYLWGVSYTSLNLYHFVNITVCYREWESPVPSPGSWEAVLITCRDWEEEVLCLVETAGSRGNVQRSCREFDRGIYMSGAYSARIWVKKMVTLFCNHRLVRMWTWSFLWGSPQISTIHCFSS